MEKDIYSLKLHESFTNNDYDILRVPGGWIYFQKYGNVQNSFPVYVPYNNEFQQKQKELFPPERKPKFNFKKSLIEIGVEDQTASDWLKVRSKKNAANTKTAFNEIKKQIAITTHKPNECIKMAVIKNWVGFKAEWYFNEAKSSVNNPNETKQNDIKSW